MLTVLFFTFDELNQELNFFLLLCVRLDGAREIKVPSAYRGRSQYGVTIEQQTFASSMVFTKLPPHLLLNPLSSTLYSPLEIFVRAYPEPLQQGQKNLYTFPTAKTMYRVPPLVFRSNVCLRGQNNYTFSEGSSTAYYFFSDCANINNSALNFLELSFPGRGGCISMEEKC